VQAARQLKANLKLQGQPCGVCQQPFELGQDVSICNECEANHHTACWDQHGGCSTQGCANAPLQKLAEPAPAELPPGIKRCYGCGVQISEYEEICPYCNAIVSSDGVYRGPVQNAPGAVASLVLGIVGLLICGIIFGILALIKSSEARRYKGDPRYIGQGMATAGMVLGIIDLVAWFFIILIRFADMG
jgi:hypothetical protein